MRKPVYLLILFFMVFQVSLCFGQESFEIVIDAPLNETVINGKIDPDGNYLLLGYEQYYVTEPEYEVFSNAIIVKINPDGQYIYKNISYPDTNCGLRNVFFTADDNYLFFGGKSGMESDSSIFWVYKTDKDLNKIWEKTYAINFIEGFRSCTFLYYGFEDAEGNYILSAQTNTPTPGSHNDLLLVKMNPEGDTLLTKQFEFQYSETFIDLQNIPNSSDILLIGGWFYNTGQTVRFMRLDSAFNIKSISAMSPPNYDLNTICTLGTWLNDTSFIFSGHLAGIDDRVQDDDIGVFVLDTNYNVLNEISFGKPDTLDYPAWVSSMAYYNDTTIYVGGFVNYLSFWDKIPNHLELYVVDKDLNMRGQALYGGDANYNMWGLMATEDGGCLMYGSRWCEENGDYERDIFIKKIGPGEVPVAIKDVKETDIMSVSVFPNPAGENICFEFNSKETDHSNYSVSLFNSLGKKLKTYKLKNSKNCFNIGNLPTGPYCYIIRNKEQLILKGKFIKL